MKKIIQIVLIITLLVLISLPFGVMVFSKFKTIVKGNGEIGVAKPILELQSMSENGLDINESTQNKDYYFKVSNHNSNNEVSKIQQKYSIEVSTKNPETLNKIKYSLYSTNEDKTSENIVNLCNNKTDEIVIDGEVKSEDFYKIHVESVNSDKDIKDEISIKLNSKSVEL